ncbi:hypothetical protein CR513_45159, partial [Mucuna pruriens]
MHMLNECNCDLLSSDKPKDLGSKIEWVSRDKSKRIRRFRDLSNSISKVDLPCGGPVIWDRHETLYTSTAAVSHNYNILHL